MGGGASKEQKKKDSKALHENLEKFNPSTMEIFRKLNLTNETLNCLWKTFIEIACRDEDSIKGNSGQKYEDHEISYKEFHDYYDLGTNHFSEIVFSRMDYGNSGEINFEEYVFSLWDFLTNDIHHFVFQVFDKDDSKFLTHDEMEQLMLCSYGVRFDEHHNAKADETTQKLLKKTAIAAVNIADRNKDKKITFEEYEFFTKANGIVEHPGSDMQEKLCKSNGGFRLWNTLRKRRQEQHQTNSIHHVLTKHAWVRRDKDSKKSPHRKKAEKRKKQPQQQEEAAKPLKKKEHHNHNVEHQKKDKHGGGKGKQTEEAAATKIQAIHRGRKSRKESKVASKHGKQKHRH